MLANSSTVTHLAIIPDGNRRWAKQNGLLAIQGHKKGFDIVEPVVRRAFDLGVRYISVWAFSTENWKRSEEEVSYLMDIYTSLINDNGRRLGEEGFRFVVSGQRRQLPEKLIKAIEEIEANTKDNIKGTVNLCLNYGGHQELIDAANKALRTFRSGGGGGVGEFNEEVFRQNLYQELPDIDLIIRTSGEKRLSGFMPWLGSYSELVFFDKHWPAFLPEDIDSALAEFAKRNRTIGGDSKS